MQQRTTKFNASEETIKIGPLGIRFLLTGDDSNGSVSVFEVLVPVRQKLAAPAHKNDAYEEVLYGIEGVFTWTVDGTPIEVGPGQALCIPRGAVHPFDNLGNKDVKQLVVISPAIMGPAYFREPAEVINASAGGPPDRAKMMDVFRRHGMTLATPPPVKQRPLHVRCRIRTVWSLKGKCRPAQEDSRDNRRASHSGHLATPRNVVESLRQHQLCFGVC